MNTSRSTWTKRLGQALRVVIVFTLVVLFARVIWTAAGTEIGFSFLGQQWKRATLGWFVNTDPVSAQLPTKQADFWLAESQRVLDAAADEDPHTRATPAMGAAIVLIDLTPAFQHEDQYFVATNMPRSVSPGWRRSGGDEGYLYEKRVMPRARQLMLLAGQLEPDNVEWARLRTNLSYSWDEELPLEEILAECASVDPDNALYDFIQAGLLFDDCQVESLHVDSWYRTKVIDATILSDAWDAVERGLAKSSYEDERALDETRLAFLQAAHVPASVHVLYFNSRTFFHGSGYMGTRLGLRDLGVAAEEQGNIRQAYEIRRTMFQLWDQFSQHPSNAGYLLAFGHVVDDARQMQEFLARYPGEFPAEEIKRADDQARQLSEAYVVRDLATKEWGERHGTKVSRNDPWGFAELCYAFALLVATPMLMLAAIVLIDVTVRKLIQKKRSLAKPGDPPSAKGLGWKSQTAAWLFAIAISFGLFGYLPVHVRWSSQGGILLGCFFAAPVSLVLALYWNLLRRKRFRLSFRTLLVLLAVLPMLLMALARLYMAFENGQVHGPHWGIDIYKADVYVAAELGQMSEPLLAVLQWLVRPGLVLMIFIWMGIVICAAWWRTYLRWQPKQRNEQTAEEQAETATPTRAEIRRQKKLRRRRNFRHFLASAWSSAAHGARVPLALLTIGYLAVLPSLMEEQQTRIDTCASLASNEASYFQEVDRIIDELLSDPLQRENIRLEAEQQLAQPLTPIYRL